MFLSTFLQKIPKNLDFFVEKLLKKGLFSFSTELTGTIKTTINYNKYLIFYKTGL